MQDWLDGYEHRPIEGCTGPGTYVAGTPWRWVAHTTEGGNCSINALIPFFQGRPCSTPHFAIDPCQRRKVQFIRLPWSSAALKNLSGGVETNRAHAVQTEITGRAAETPSWPDEWVTFVGEHIADLVRAGVPLNLNNVKDCVGPEAGTIATPHAPQRMSYAEWNAFDGICFAAGTLVLTAEGMMPIEDVSVGDLVLTHAGRFRAVTDVKVNRSATLTLKGHGHPGLVTTPEHPFLAVGSELVRDNSTPTRWRRLEFSDPEWVEAKDLVGRYWATPTEFPVVAVPMVDRSTGKGRRSIVEVTPALLRLAGRWVADGHLSDDGKITVSCHRDEEAQVIGEMEAAGFDRHHSSVGGPNVVQVTCSSVDLAGWLVAHFGRYAWGKEIPAWLLGAEEKFRSEFFDGYMAGDGHIESSGVFEAKTVSKRLAIGVRLLAESLGYSTAMYLREGGPAIIEGRTVSTRDAWRIKGRVPGGRGAATTVIDGHRFARVKDAEFDPAEVVVYNLAVEEDESYVADGIVVHNCGHQHVPENDHWDPGNLNVQRAVQHAKAILGGTVTPPPGPPPAPPAPVGPRTLSKGSKGEDVARWQSRLAGRGYWIAADGDFGSLTDGVTRWFQSARGIVADGIVGPQTYAAMDAAESEGWKPSNMGGAPVPSPAPPPPHPPWPGRYLMVQSPLMRGDDVRQWQQQMAARGWRIGVDGIFGEESRRVCSAFQAEKGLAADGIVGYSTWTAAWTKPVT